MSEREREHRGASLCCPASASWPLLAPGSPIVFVRVLICVIIFLFAIFLCCCHFPPLWRRPIRVCSKAKTTVRCYRCPCRLIPVVILRDARTKDLPTQLLTSVWTESSCLRSVFWSRCLAETFSVTVPFASQDAPVPSREHRLSVCSSDTPPQSPPPLQMAEGWTRVRSRTRIVTQQSKQWCHPQWCRQNPILSLEVTMKRTGSKKKSKMIWHQTKKHTKYRTSYVVCLAGVWWSQTQEWALSWFSFSPTIFCWLTMWFDVCRNWISIDREQNHPMWALVCDNFTVICWSSLYVGSGIKHVEQWACVGYV